MPSELSERRLHPLSFLFQMASQMRQLLLPAVFLLFAGTRTGEGAWQVWALALVVPFTLIAIAQTLVFRYRMDADGLLLQSGLIFRQQRHVPYERVQNIDAIQNVAHRALGVVDVRLETAGGQEPEAHLSVLSVAAFDELRARVQAGRAHLAKRELARVADRDASAAAAESADTLLQLSTRDLVVCGLIQGRGLIVLGALFGLLWEAGLMDRLTSALVGERLGGRGVAREFLQFLFGQGVPPIGRIGITVAAFAVFILITRLFSVGWALVRLHAFHLRRIGDDLRADFGLLTRIAATVPIRRVQSVTIHEGPLHRLFGRVSVRVETAGGETDASVQLQRQWLAPVIRPADLPRLLHHVLPVVEPADLAWQPVDPRGVRRVRIRWIAVAAMLTVGAWGLLGRSALLVLLSVAIAGELDARRSVAALGWAVTGGGVFFRRGWLWRRQTIAPLAKVQSVVLRESPFDRRLSMARVEVDTAGGAEDGRISVPYLPRPTALELGGQLSAEAARTTFRW